MWAAAQVQTVSESAISLQLGLKLLLGALLGTRCTMADLKNVKEEVPETQAMEETPETQEVQQQADLKNVKAEVPETQAIEETPETREVQQQNAEEEEEEEELAPETQAVQQEGDGANPFHACNQTHTEHCKYLRGKKLPDPEDFVQPPIRGQHAFCDKA